MRLHSSGTHYVFIKRARKDWRQLMSRKEEQNLYDSEAELIWLSAPTEAAV